VWQSKKTVAAVLEAASQAAGTLALMGRDLKVVKAVEKTAATAMTEAEGGKGKLKGRVDRRHVYLCNEGLVVEDETDGQVGLGRGLEAEGWFLEANWPSISPGCEGRSGQAAA
jgi:hypothetical protein